MSSLFKEILHIKILLRLRIEPFPWIIKAARVYSEIYLFKTFLWVAKKGNPSFTFWNLYTPLVFEIQKQRNEA